MKVNYIKFPTVKGCTKPIGNKVTSKRGMYVYPMYDINVSITHFYNNIFLLFCFWRWPIASYNNIWDSETNKKVRFYFSENFNKPEVVKTNFENVDIGAVVVNIFYTEEFLYQKVMVLTG